MSRTNVFAMKNNGVNLFLFADVGTENNGSMLTVLSVLARLGLDPWAQAAQWMRLPKAEIIDRLASSIAQMPLVPRTMPQWALVAAVAVMLALAIGGTLVSTPGNTNTAVAPFVQTGPLSPIVPSR